MVGGLPGGGALGAVAAATPSTVTTMATQGADKAIATNPVSTVARAKHQKPLPAPFSREEAEAIVADMAAHCPAPITNYVEFKFFTGLRTSESFGLRWRDVDLAGKHLLVHRAIVRGVEKLNTKTNTARQVNLNSRALAAVQRQRKHIRHEHVFLDPRYGEPWLMMLMAGMTPAFCAMQLGHSVEMFLRTDARWIDGGQNPLEMGRLEAALTANLSPIYPKKGR